MGNVSLSINCRGKLITLDKPVVMGIINVNQDSFYPGSRVQTVESIVERAGAMLGDGAAILDVGGMSSRPGAEIISSEEELARILPAIDAIKNAFPEAIVSVDTLRSEVAAAAVQSGASIINDISAGEYDSNMMKTVGLLKTPYIMMHMQGLPATMQKAPVYQDVVLDIMKYFVNRIQQARSHGIMDLVIDPGFGFGKLPDQNYALMKKLEVFQIFDVPVLIGVSRKSMISKLLGIDSSEALNGTTAMHMFALQKGVKILRVHDVRAAMECIKIYNKLAET